MKLENQKLEFKLNEIQFLFNQNKFELCLAKINKLIKQYKKEYLPYNYRGIVFLSLKKNVQALDDFKTSVSLNPNFSEGFNNIGLAYIALDRKDQAMNAFKKALSINPDSINLKINLGILYSEFYSYSQAIDTFQSVLNVAAGQEHVHQLIADVYIKLYKYDLALSHHIKARDINPANFMNYYLIGSDFLWSGNKELAAKNFRQAIEINPHYCQSFYGVSRAENIRIDDPLFQKAMDLLHHSSLPDIEKTFLNFFIAKVYEQSNHHELFFNYLNQGCSIQRQIDGYKFEDSEKIQRNVKNCYERNIATFQANFFVHNKSKHEISPIFIVGMPRSGTSLLEQILSNHSEVFGAGELNIIHSEMEKIFLSNPDPEVLIKKLLTLRETYLNHLSAISDKQFITDKLPLNFQWLGYIKLMFPNAKIININRNPIATSFSIYKTLFTKGSLKFSYNFKDIINFYKLYECTIQFWSKYLPNDIMQIDYEELVNKPSYYANELCKFINLSYENHITNLALNNRPVLTASDLQIRNEIYTNSSLAWKKYENFLQEFIEAFS